MENQRLIEPIERCTQRQRIRTHASEIERIADVKQLEIYVLANDICRVTCWTLKNNA